MKALVIGLAIFLACYLIILFTRMYKTGHFLRAFALSALSGIAALVTVNLLSSLTAVKIALNGWSIGASALFGLPGVVGLLVMNLFF